jgi:hypothetical protein
MTEPAASEVDDEDPYDSHTEHWYEVTRRVATDPLLDAVLFAEALQFALIKAANIILSELADVTARQAARREHERTRPRAQRQIRKQNPRRRSTPAGAGGSSTGATT